MNINEEGKYYASMVRKFRTEYKSKNLHGFCKEQKVSYTKMLHCLLLIFVSTIWIQWSIFAMCSAESRKLQRTNWWTYSLKDGSCQQLLLGHKFK